jgi:hypothetical protein
MRLFLNGIPLAAPSVRVVFQGNAVINAELPLRRYAQTTETRVLLPGEQAAAALLSAGRPVIALETEDGVLVPKWLIW